MGSHLCPCNDRTEGHAALLLIESESESDDYAVFKTGRKQQKSSDSSSLKKKPRVSTRQSNIDTEYKPSPSDDEEKQESKPNVKRSVLTNRVSETSLQCVVSTQSITYREKKEDTSNVNLKICTPTAATISVKSVEKFSEADDGWLSADGIEDFRDVRISVRYLPEVKLDELHPKFKMYSSETKPSPITESRQFNSNQSLFHYDSNWTDEQVSNTMREMTEEVLYLRRLSTRNEPSYSSTSSEPDDVL